MRKIFLIMVALLFAPLLRSQSTSDGIVAEIVAAGSKIHGLDCDFVQERTSTLMAETMTSKGRMSYKAPSGLVWEYTEPMKMTFRMEGGEVKLEKDGAAVAADPNQKKMYREIARLILSCVNGRILSDKSVFETKASSVKGMWVVEMTPVRKDLARMWSSLNMVFDPGTKNAVKIELIEPSGDSTVIKFSNTKCD